MGLVWRETLKTMPKSDDEVAGLEAFFIRISGILQKTRESGFRVETVVFVFVAGYFQSDTASSIRQSKRKEDFKDEENKQQNESTNSRASRRRKKARDRRPDFLSRSNTIALTSMYCYVMMWRIVMGFTRNHHFWTFL